MGEHNHGLEQVLWHRAGGAKAHDSVDGIERDPGNDEK